MAKTRLQVNRRQFLAATGIGGLTICTGSVGFSQPRSLVADVVIAGGGVGGFAAALALLRNGYRVIMTEETDWIGGQLTQQAVPPDESPWIEQFGGTRSYRRWREDVREYYRRNYPLTVQARKNSGLNPGNCTVSRLCSEPRACLAALDSLLVPYLGSQRLTLLLEHKVIAADVAGSRVKALKAQSRLTGTEVNLVGSYFLDATEAGELLPLTGTEYLTGAESREDTGELHAKARPEPLNMQAITWCFAMDYIDGEDHTIEKPEEYDFWRAYVPKLSPPWPGKQLSWIDTHPVTLDPRTHTFNPKASGREGGLWAYRRLTDPGNFEEGAYRGGITLVNWPQNDYWLGNVIEVPEAEVKRNLTRARQLSLSLLYWMQTEAPRADGGTGWPGLRLRGDVTGTDYGLAKSPYIRESRRIRAEFRVLEKHVGLEQRIAETGLSKDEVTAAEFEDSVGIGSYRIDLHPSTGGDNYIDISSLPFQIPLGSLIPVRMENLLPACKNLGVTHITNGCYRLHPVEWNIGEAAGMLAAFCLRTKEPPRAVRNTARLLKDYQRELELQGIETRWPDPRRMAR
ncbi:MAG: FAD-dependent oxidoreductase [Acidobacteria bacterium]|nr:MAG: FAD-dependent oxidoreductase [Acidobacteriota bacterium]